MVIAMLHISLIQGVKIQLFWQNISLFWQNGIEIHKKSPQIPPKQDSGESGRHIYSRLKAQLRLRGGGP
jgi:hypothetical protein